MGAFNMEITSNDLKTKLISGFESFENELVAQKKWHFNHVRRTCIENFSALGFPTLKHEEWKYTNLNFLFKNNFIINPTKTNIEIREEDIKEFLFEDLFDNLLVFVNGHFSKNLSRIVSGEKIIIKSLAEGIEENFELVEQYVGSFKETKNDAFTAINTAYLTDGAFIVVPDDAENVEPIHLLYINDARENSYWSNPRNLILVGKNCKIRIVETCQTIGDLSALSNSVTEIIQKPYSVVDYYKLQNDSGNLYLIGTTHVHQQNDSVFNSSTISLHGKFIRNNLTTVFEGEHSEANFSGFYFIDDDDFVDNHTLADHAFPECNSNELYKGILNDKSHAVFNGKIIVRKDAQKTIAYQSNKNILLTNDATINTKPQLEIFADDVKCSHGATTGTLDNEALFYLRARGIGEDKAKALLLNAFASDVISKINIPELRDNIKNQVSKRLNVEDIYFCGFLNQ